VSPALCSPAICRSPRPRLPERSSAASSFATAVKAEPAAASSKPKRTARRQRGARVPRQTRRQASLFLPRSTHTFTLVTALRVLQRGRRTRRRGRRRLDPGTRTARGDRPHARAARRGALRDLCRGPGRLSRALDIDRSLDGVYLLSHGRCGWRRRIVRALASRRGRGSGSRARPLCALATTRAEAPT